MPFEFEKSGRYQIPRAKDRRTKLTDDARQYIRRNPHDMSQMELARKFKVSKRLVQFVQSPEKAQANLDRREERGGSMQYYDKERHRGYMQRYRTHKKWLHQRNQLEATKK